MRRLLSVLALLLAFAASSNAEQPQPKVSCGPWITNVTQTGFTVLFCSDVNTLAWVEYSPDDGTSMESFDRPKVFETVSGRRKAGFFHSIRISGLQSGQRYKYRIYGTEVIDEETNAYSTRFGRTRRMFNDNYVTTLDPDAGECNFVAVNDIHANEELFSAVAAKTDPKAFDFLLMNGDIVSESKDIDTVIKYTFKPIESISASLPVIYARGNHEGRGRDWYLVPKLFPTTTGEFYFSFRQGPVAFLVLDMGEDKPDTSNEYSNTAEYDAYRAAELEWLKRSVKDPSFAEAPFKVVLCHIPPVREKNAWHTIRWMCDNVTPVLNEAGVDLMLSGHYHKYRYAGPGKYNNEFPILVNDRLDRLIFHADSKEMTIDTYDGADNLTHHFTYKAK